MLFKVTVCLIYLSKNFVFDQFTWKLILILPPEYTGEPTRNCIPFFIHFPQPEAFGNLCTPIQAVYHILERLKDLKDSKFHLENSANFVKTCSYSGTFPKDYINATQKL